jgi:hypothetical protein
VLHGRYRWLKVTKLFGHIELCALLIRLVEDMFSFLDLLYYYVVHGMEDS